MKISIVAADKYYALLVKERAGNKCERCERSDGVLQCSHHWSRRIKLLRWDPLNAFCLCFQCHLWWHSNPGESGVWLRNKIGEDQYAYLVSKAREPFKLDNAMKAHILKNLKNSLKYFQAFPPSSNEQVDFRNPYLGTVEPLARKPRKKAKKVKRIKVQSKFKRKVSGEVVAR